MAILQKGLPKGYKALVGLVLAALFASVACSGDSDQTTQPSTSALDEARQKIQHVVVIMQENRSFDHYFGTYPGADGIPMQEDGTPSVCAPDSQTGECVKPFHDPNDRDYGGPHAFRDAVIDVDGGKMDGFVQQEREGVSQSNKEGCKGPFDPACGGVSGEEHGSMGYHDAREIPNYWAYAQNFVLQDRMFEPNASWSLPAHLFMVSGWSAKCSTPGDPMSCQNELQDTYLSAQKRNDALAQKGNSKRYKANSGPDFAWTDLTYLLQKTT